MTDTPSTYYIHYNYDCKSFFEQLSYLVNLRGVVSCKRKEMLRMVQVQKIAKGLELNNIESGQGLNQFVFMARLMLVILGYIDELCKALQRRDQDIVNAMTFARLTKKGRLQKIRDDGWEHFLGSVSHMDDNYIPSGRSRRYFEKVTNLHRFRDKIFISVIDLQLQELNNRFGKVNVELLIYMASFNPVNCSAAYDKQKLLTLAEFYPKDFSCTDMIRHKFQLDHFIDDVRKDARFESVQDIAQLSMKLVETNKHILLVLILPVATASVEGNSMGDQLLNDALVTAIERDFFSQDN
ncbi:hypothetical protein RND81_09G043900 [Saponaria officinalis]|uniref:Uncharacterized protein n=1 Tax=Saponaria officinalis TaxID=3572 RepID=A0AAW1IGJ6_SAPOF